MAHDPIPDSEAKERARIVSVTPLEDRPDEALVVRATPSIIGQALEERGWAKQPDLPLANIEPTVEAQAEWRQQKEEGR